MQKMQVKKSMNDFFYLKYQLYERYPMQGSSNDDPVSD